MTHGSAFHAPKAQPNESITRRLTSWMTAAGVRFSDDGGFQHRRMFDQRAFDFERADPVGGTLDHIVAPADEPVVAVGVAPRDVAGQIPVAAEAALVFLGVAPVFLEQAE